MQVFRGLNEWSETLKVPESARKYAYACTWGTRLKGLRQLRVGIEYGDRGEGACTCVPYSFNYWQVWTDFYWEISCERFKPLNRGVYRMFDMRFAKHRDANLWAIFLVTLLYQRTPANQPLQHHEHFNQFLWTSLLLAPCRTRAERRRWFWTVISVTQLNSDQCYTAGQWSVLTQLNSDRCQHGWTATGVYTAEQRPVFTRLYSDRCLHGWTATGATRLNSDRCLHSRTAIGVT
jgi:hypothetical protein